MRQVAQPVVERDLHARGGHGEPTTSVVLSSPVTRKAIPPASRR